MNEHYIISILSTIIDFAALCMYFYILMPRPKRNIRFPHLACSFVLSTLIVFITTELLINTFTVTALLIRVSVSVITTFLLTFLFESTLLSKFFITIGFQALFAISEFFSQFIVQFFIYKSSDVSCEVTDGINFITPLIFFLLLFFISLIPGLKKHYINKRFSILLMIPPIITVLLSSNRSIININVSDPISYTLFIFGLLIINISNYFTLTLSAKWYEEKERNNLILRQNEYQQKKYAQLSSAYKNLRRYQHDTKNRFIYISNCIKTKKYDEIIPYLEESLNDLDASYTRVNTGNLVIDSFVSNCISVAADNNIEFKYDLKVDPAVIPVNDYDLSIIIGNLLDNALNACNKITDSYMKYIKLSIHTNSEYKQFIIRVINSCRTDKIDESKNNLSHGYGISNIQNHIEKYQGIMNNLLKDNEYDCSVIIPFKN